MKGIGTGSHGSRLWTKLVDDWRTADAAEAAKRARCRFEERHKFLALHPLEVFGFNARTAAKRGTMLLLAHGTMTMARSLQLPGDREPNAAAEATSVYFRHVS